MAFTSMALLTRSLRALTIAPSIVRCQCSSSSDSGSRSGRGDFTRRIKKELEAKNPFHVPERAEFANPNRPPSEADVVIIGGGIVGSSIAYHLTREAEAGLNVLVVEKDNTYTRAATTLSVGGIRQQFSIQANVEMSMYGSQFIKTIKEHLCVDDADPPDIQFNQSGYLLLASEEGVDQLVESHKMQRECGAQVELLTAKQLSNKFPWLNTSDLAMGSFGFENEGWFDPWSLLKAFKEKALSLGATYVNAEVTGFGIDKVPKAGAEMAYYTGSGRRVKTVEIQLPNSPETVPVKASLVVLAAGPWSGQVAELLDIGRGTAEDLLDVGLPVWPRKRFAYVVHAPDGPGLDCPLVIDNSGVYFRREGLGGNYVCGRSPPREVEEPSIDDMQIDYDFFNEHIWPIMAQRVPAFENLKVKSAWAGFYDYNTLDQNAIVGIHPAYPNLYMATGFSGHGLQHAPAAGMAISDLILQGKFCTLDLSSLSFDRVMQNQPMPEKKIF